MATVFNWGANLIVALTFLNIMSKLILITDRVRSTRGGYIFSLSVSSHLGGGYPIQVWTGGGTPSRSRWGPAHSTPLAGGHPPGVPPSRGAPTWGSPRQGGAHLGYPPSRGGAHLLGGGPPRVAPPWQGGTHLGYPPGRGVPTWGTPPIRT